MKRFKHYWAVLTLSLLPFLILPAGAADNRAQAAPAQPSAPYVSPVPKTGEWSMVARRPGSEAVASAGAKAPDSPEPPGITKSVTVTKKDHSMRITVETTGGKAREYFVVGEYVLNATSSGQIQIVQPDWDSQPYPYFSKGFYGFEWLTPESFVGVETYAGKKCFHYKAKDSGDEAWTDAASQMPVAAKYGGEMLEYAFHPTLRSIELPAAYQKALKGMRDSAAKLAAVKTR